MSPLPHRTPFSFKVCQNIPAPSLIDRKQPTARDHRPSPHRNPPFATNTSQIPQPPACRHHDDGRHPGLIPHAPHPRRLGTHRDLRDPLRSVLPGRSADIDLPRIMEPDRHQPGDRHDFIDRRPHILRTRVFPSVFLSAHAPLLEDPAAFRPVNPGRHRPGHDPHRPLRRQPASCRKPTAGHQRPE